jgi:hypothetical protein
MVWTGSIWQKTNGYIASMTSLDPNGLSWNTNNRFAYMSMDVGARVADTSNNQLQIEDESGSTKIARFALATEPKDNFGTGFRQLWSSVVRHLATGPHRLGIIRIADFGFYEDINIGNIIAYTGGVINDTAGANEWVSIKDRRFWGTSEAPMFHNDGDWKPYDAKYDLNGNYWYDRGTGNTGNHMCLGAVGTWNVDTPPTKIRFTLNCSIAPIVDDYFIEINGNASYRADFTFGAGGTQIVEIDLAGLPGGVIWHLETRGSNVQRRINYEDIEVFFP